MQYDACVYWNKGAAKDINRDSLVLMQAFTVRGRILLAAVCDGMGKMGEYASGYLTEELVTWFREGLPDALLRRNTLSAIKRLLERRLYRAQFKMQEYAQRYSYKMGTTLSMIIVWEKKYMLWQWGNGRIYRFSDKRTEQILSDYEMGTINAGDAFLICSDAFARRITAAEIAEVFSPHGMTEERCKRRFKEAGEASIRRGECENMSAVYVKAINTRIGKRVNPQING